MATQTAPRDNTITKLATHPSSISTGLCARRRRLCRVARSAAVDLREARVQGGECELPAAGLGRLA